MYRLKILFLALLLSACVSNRNKAKLKSGEVNYQIHLEPSKAGEGMEEAFGTSATASFNEAYLRLVKHSEVPGDEFYVTNLATREETSYLEVEDDKYAVQVDRRFLPPAGELTFHDSYKTIAGYRCQKATAPMGSDEMVVYFTKELGVNYCPYTKLEGFALEYTLILPLGKVTYTATEVLLKSLKTAEIKPQEEEYQLVSMTAFNQIMKDKMNKLSTGETAASFQKTTLEGLPVSLASLRGKAVVMNFWFAACPPCKAEIPDLNALKAELADQPVEFLAITYDKPNVVKSFLQKNPFDFQIIPQARDIIRDYEIVVYPTTVILDKNGKIVHTKMGGSYGIKEELKSVIENILNN